MRWWSALSREADTDAAVDALVDELARCDAAPDLAFLFASEHHAAAFARLPAVLRERLAIRRLLGCSASGVVGGGLEVEHAPALGLTMAELPGVDVAAWHLDAAGLAPGSAHSERCASLAAGAAAPGQLLVLADPFTFPAEQLLRAVEAAFGGAVIAGGLASGAGAAGEAALFLDDESLPGGAVVLALSGNVEMITAVAQGCRPIGQPMFVSACEGNRIAALDGQSPMAVLDGLYRVADAAERALMQHSLFLGLAMRGGETTYAAGDYLVRNIAGADPDSGALYVAGAVREHQVVQFHVRDAATSAADLDAVLATLGPDLGDRAPAGGLLFSCLGRGAGLYGESGHDSARLRAAVGDVPLGGFFCNGEIGPVAGTAYLHAYTSAFALFRPHAAGAAAPNRGSGAT